VCKVVASHDRRTLAFYRIDSTEQYEALLNYQIKALEGSNTKSDKKR
jgi:hypothetical protein